MATLSATGQEKYHHGFEPMLPGMRLVTFDDVDAVETAVNEKTAAVMVEPIQGEGGVVVPARPTTWPACASCATATTCC